MERRQILKGLLGAIGVLVLGGKRAIAGTEYAQTNSFVDADGKVRLEMGVKGDRVIFEMRDGKGRPQVSISAEDDGQVHIQLLQQNGNLASLAVDGNGPNLTLVEQREALQVTVSRGTERIRERGMP